MDAGAKIQSFSKRKEKKRVFCKQPLCTIIYLHFSPDNLCTPVLTLEVAFAGRFGFWVVIRQLPKKPDGMGLFCVCGHEALKEVVRVEDIIINGDDVGVREHLEGG